MEVFGAIILCSLEVDNAVRRSLVVDILETTDLGEFFLDDSIEFVFWVESVLHRLELVGH